MTTPDSNSTWLVPGLHYLKTKDHLYLDGLICHAMYVKYMRQVEHTPPVIEDLQQFKPLIETEPYCIGISEIHASFAKTRKVIKLDLALMEAKGIDTTAFSEKR